MMFHSNMKCVLASGVAVVAVLFAASADAQDPVNAAASAATPGGGPSAPTAGSGDRPGANGEILVTARKRQERNIDVPVTVQAFSAATLEKSGTTSVNGLYATVPNLYFSSNLLSPGRDFLNLVIRGVGAQSAGQPAVATIIDGVYQPSLAFDTDFLDAATVEVLKGPQGTIFGRNTEGGALSITLRKPDDQLRGKVAVTVDNFATMQLQGQVSGPITDNFFAGLALDASHTDGYLNNPTLGNVSADQSRKFVGRIALRWKPTERLDINFSVDGSNTRGLDGLPGVPRGDHKYEVLSDFQIDALYKSLGGALNAAYDFGSIQLTSITAARKLDSNTPYDFSGGPVGGVNYPDELSDLQIHQSILSQELRLNGTSFGNRFHWLAGAYVFREKNTLLRRLSLAYLPAFGTSYDSYQQDQHLTDSGFAFFADGTFDLSHALSLDLGVRYGHERTQSNFFQYAVIPGIITVDGGVNAAIASNYVTPSASLLYHFTPNATIYVRYAKGVRAGGFPLAPTPSSDIAFKPEKTDNFEIGTKGRIFDGVFGYDLSAFYIKLTNQQVTSIAFVDGNPNIPVATTTNAGKSSSRGFEANFNINPTKPLALTANFGYTDAHYNYYIDTVGNNRAGERFPFVPRFTAAGTAAYTIDLPHERSLTLTGEYQHVGSILSGSGVDIDLQFHVKAYNLVNLRASLALNPRLKLDIFCKNLLDKFIETRVFNTFFFVTPRPFSTVLPPRNVGARLSFAF